MIRIAGIESESIVDGVGIRYVVFTQGCPHHCLGCQNIETWDPIKGSDKDTRDIVKEFTSNACALIDGITLSGGEPFEQPDACLVLARAAKEHGLTVWCYTGYVYEELLSAMNPAVHELLKNIDVLVDGRFIQEMKSLNIGFRGSTNQRILHLKDGKIEWSE